MDLDLYPFSYASTMGLAMSVGWPTTLVKIIISRQLLDGLAKILV